MHTPINSRRPKDFSLVTTTANKTINKLT